MSETIKPQDTRETFLDYEENVALLGMEIRFWQEMIEYREAGTPDESVERMQQALSLAQSRMHRLMRQHQAAVTLAHRESAAASCENTPDNNDNVVCLEWWRSR